MSKRKRRAWNKLDQNVEDILSDVDFRLIDDVKYFIHKALIHARTFSNQLDEWSEDSWLRTTKRRINSRIANLEHVQDHLDRFDNPNKRSFYDLVEIREFSDIISQKILEVNLTPEQHKELHGYLTSIRSLACLTCETVDSVLSKL